MHHAASQAESLTATLLWRCPDTNTLPISCYRTTKSSELPLSSSNMLLFLRVFQLYTACMRHNMFEDDCIWCHNLQRPSCRHTWAADPFLQRNVLRAYLHVQQ